MDQSYRSSPLFRLSDDDLAMVCTFVLLSGSVKALAESYGVSYPTMRSRLDGLIERLRRHVEDRPIDPVSEHLAEMIAKGRIAAADAAKLRDLHRQMLAKAPTTPQEKTSHERHSVNI